MTGFITSSRNRAGAVVRAVAALGGVAIFIAAGECVAADDLQSPPTPAATGHSEKPADGTGRIRLQPPGQRKFILDRADSIAASDQRRIRELATALLNDKATPIVVVTIESMAAYGGAGMSIEQFAQRLFDQWGIGQASLDGQPWNTGILLLVSRDDRKVRIELGAGWKHERDTLAQRIVDEQIVPRFRQDDFSGGVTAGVEALDKMARGLALPDPPLPRWRYLVGAVIIFGAFLSVILSMHRSIARRSEGADAAAGAGGFAGGSFGGGYSGGGGATGAW